MHGPPEQGGEFGLYTKLMVKKNGFITYWGAARELDQSKIHRVKVRGEISE